VPNDLDGNDSLREDQSSDAEASGRTGGVAGRSSARRRPSGEPTPLPRDPWAGSGRIWLPLGLLTLFVFVLLISPSKFALAQGSFWDDIDQGIVDWVKEIRTDVLTDLSRGLNVFTEAWFLRILRWGALIGLVFFKRWRHLFAFFGIILVIQPAIFALSTRMARPRPDGVEILAKWAEFASPSLAIGALTITLLGLIYSFVVSGRWRRIALLAAALIVVLVGVSRVYLAVDRVTDGLSGAILATAVTLLVFRLWTPDAVFPVTYSSRKTAHLELTDLRREAIFKALSDQLGLRAIDVKLFGLEASGGSTPLLITLENGDHRHVFAKLYAHNHLRSDRWYKLGRSLLYGALEDERPFKTVRALAQHEDYIMRLMQAAGVPGPRSYGIVEITRGREYLLVAEFIEGAEEMSQAEVNGAIVFAGLAAIRSMWDAGLAHRDVKPGNILVRGNDIFLIDAAFGETRPSAWREAVDLANMMLTLSLRTSPDEVYRAAREQFTEDDVAEALAATRGVTIPSELKHGMKEDQRDVLGVLRRLAPERKPIRIQRWTRRRVSSLIGVGALTVVTAWLAVINLTLVGNLL
jgi:tRNA A-37 threonylcarbamoyl transferase component Bud32/membrane-associated phospholipid phosphatase